jgi:hypothetical protein
MKSTSKSTSLLSFTESFTKEPNNPIDFTPYCANASLASATEFRMSVLQYTFELDIIRFKQI